MNTVQIILLSLLVLITSVIIYQTFLADWFDNKAEAKKTKATKLNSVTKMAMIKMVSDDPKEIENFVSNNVEYLSDQTVQQFVDRIESLKADSVIKLCDNVLKQKIEDVSVQDEQEKKKVNRAKSSR
jgi:predicted Zn-dependent peptidase